MIINLKNGGKTLTGKEIIMDHLSKISESESYDLVKEIDSAIESHKIKQALGTKLECATAVEKVCDKWEKENYLDNPYLPDIKISLKNACMGIDNNKKKNKLMMYQK